MENQINDNSNDHLKPPDQTVPETISSTKTTEENPGLIKQFSKLTKYLPLGISAIFILFLTAFAVSGLIRTRANPTLPVAQGPTPTGISINPQNMDIYPYATAAAFLALEVSHSSISSRLTPFVIEDQSILPPVIEMSLGFESD
jgi:hypothetical protein